MKSKITTTIRAYLEDSEDIRKTMKARRLPLMADALHERLKVKSK